LSWSMIILHPISNAFASHFLWNSTHASGWWDQNLQDSLNHQCTIRNSAILTIFTHSIDTKTSMFRWSWNYMAQGHIQNEYTVRVSHPWVTSLLETQVLIHKHLKTGND
jgi:hypothetical protein